MRFARPYISEQQAEQISQFGELAIGRQRRVRARRRAVHRGVPLPRAGRPPKRWCGRGSASILAEGARYTRASLSLAGGDGSQPRAAPRAEARRPAHPGLLPGPGHVVRDRLRRPTDRGRGDAGERGHLLDRRRRAHGPHAGGRRHGTRRRSTSCSRSRVEAGMDENRREGMRAVAEETGGLAVHQPQRHRQGAAARILADNELYYLLAYQPTSSGRPGRFRRIEVRLPGRPGLVARTRRRLLRSRAGAGAAEAVVAGGGRGRATRAGPRRPDVDRSAERRARATRRRLRGPARGRPRGRGQRRHRRGRRPPPVPRGGRGRRHRGRRSGHEPGRRSRSSSSRRECRSRRSREPAGIGPSGHARRPTVAATPPRPLPGARRRAGPGTRGRGQRVAVGRGAGPVDAPTGVERPLPLAGGRGRRTRRAPPRLALAPVPRRQRDRRRPLRVQRRDGRRRRHRPGAPVPAGAGRPAGARVPAPPDGARPCGLARARFRRRAPFARRTSLPASTSCGPSSRTGPPRPRPSGASASRSSSAGAPTAVTYGCSGTSISRVVDSARCGAAMMRRLWLLRAPTSSG